MQGWDDYIAISALQHYAYCPRQFALIHLEQAWLENRYTMEGKLLHKRVDSGCSDRRNSLKSERDVLLTSQKLGLTGKMDLLEITMTQAGGECYLPVEYKRGKPKVEPWDKIQVCAQALCLEEMKDCLIDEAAIWYWETRKREYFPVDTNLRGETLECIERAREVLLSQITPDPTAIKSRCRACSLIDLCQPSVFRKDNSKCYVANLFDNPCSEEE